MSTQGKPHPEEPTGPSRPGAGGAGRLTPAEFADLFETHGKAFWYIAAAVLGGPSQAADAVQEAAAIGLEKLHQFDRATSFQAWMGQIVRFTALNMGRRRQTERQHAASPEQAAHEPAAPAGATRVAISSFGELLVDQDQFDDSVRDALMRLDETARACLLLRTVADLSYKEIAASLSIPEGTAMSHVHRARQAMRSALVEPRASAAAPEGAR